MFSKPCISVPSVISSRLGHTVIDVITFWFLISIDIQTHPLRLIHRNRTGINKVLIVYIAALVILNIIYPGTANLRLPCLAFGIIVIPHKSAPLACLSIIPAYLVHRFSLVPIIFSVIRELDCYIAQFIREHGGTVDYVHGEQELKALTLNGGAGVLLPAIKKEDFFKTIISGGELPRKTFSMGEGDEKRFYIEAKLIK